MISKRSRCELGQDLVEYAITLPVFLLIVFGIFDLGRAVYYYSAIANAARDGARYGSVHPEAPTNEIIARVEYWLAALDDSNTDIVICSTGETSCVTVTFTFEPVTPIIGQFLGEDNQITLGTKSSMPLEYIP